MYFTVILDKKNDGFWVGTEISYGIIFGYMYHYSACYFRYGGGAMAGIQL